MPPTITRVSEIADTGDRGQIIPSIRVEFKIGDHGPFTVVLPKAGFTGAAAMAKMQEFAAQLAALGTK